jgi:uncharacterized protein YndB with AHSA1/START domain
MSNPEDGTRTLVIEKVFHHPPEKLWRALTETPLLAQWLFKSDFAPEVGRKFQFRADPVPGWDGLIDCEVLVVDPLKSISYTWASLGVGTVVLWTLTPTEGGTHVRMEQSGFSADQQKNYQGAKYGWQKFIGNLEKVVAEME